MQLNITTTHYPATDLGYLLHKHPDKFQSFELAMGKAHVFYPEKSNERTTATLLLDIDPIEMVRGSRGQGDSGFSLEQYVNDRPYAASSFLSAAIAKAYSSALNGRCKDRPELVDTAMPFEVTIPVLPAPQGGEKLIRNLFEPLGYQVVCNRHPLDEKFPEWGDSRYYFLKLTHHLTLKEVLSHIYVLIPALDNEKHYFVARSEIEKLLEKGEGWLKQHPERDQIVRRYLVNLNYLSREAIRRLAEEDGVETVAAEPGAESSEVSKRKISLHEKRLDLVAEKIRSSGAAKVLDLGCGEGKLLRLLLKNPQITHISAMDVSYSELLKAKERLHFDELSPRQKERIHLFQGSLTYRDKRFEGFDAAAVVEVIEHMDTSRLGAFEKVLFGFARPGKVFITTPNKEYNQVWEGMEEGNMRHTDHRFEWTRAEFARWAKGICSQYPYQVEILPAGDEHEVFGAPSQLAIFTYGN